MKQLFIVTDTTYAHGLTDGLDLSVLEAGAVAFTQLSDQAKVTTAIAENVACWLGRDNLVPRNIPEIDFKTLHVVKAEPQDAQALEITITPTVDNMVEGDIYTVILTKKGVGFNERANWTLEYVTTSDNDTVANICAAIAAQVEAKMLPFSVTDNSTDVVLEVTDGSDWAVTVADDFEGTAVITQDYIPATGDTAYVKKLARECAANKGFEYLADDGIELYPGFPEAVAADKYIIYTLRWRVSRDSAKTRDERVWQLLHIAVPTTSTSVESALDTILGTGE